VEFVEAIAVVDGCPGFERLPEGRVDEVDPS